MASRRELELMVEAKRRGIEISPPQAMTEPVVQKNIESDIAPVELSDEQKAAKRKANMLAAGRTTAIGVGATVGAAVGTPLGPAGMLAGSALGAAAGEALMGGIEGRPPQETAMRALDEAKTDLLFTGVTSSLRPLIQMLGGARRSFLGVGEKELERVIEAKKFGVDLGASEVSRFSGVKNAIHVVGRFPFLGGPAKQSAAQKAAQVFQGEERILARLGPTANLAEAGVDLNKAAKTAFKGFRDEAAVLYNKSRAIADAQGKIIPTHNIKKTAKAIAENFDAARPGRTGTKSPVVKFSETLNGVPDNLSGSEFDALVDDLDVALAQAKNDGFSIKQGMTLKSASEIDLRSSRSPEFVEALKEADEFFTKGMNTFETATAQKFNRVSKNAFNVKLSKPGNLNEDELFRVAFNTRSPKAMTDLRQLVGPKAFNKAVRGHIEKAFTAAKVTAEDNVHVFNPKKFIKALGLEDKNSPQYAALQKALQSTGLNPDDLTRFARVASDALSTEVPNVSTFIARRATIGGVQSGLRALLPGLVATGGAIAGSITPAVAVFTTLAARQGVKVLTNPKTLKLATKALDKEVAIAARRAAAVRIVRLGMQQEESSPEDLATEIQ